MYELFKIKFRLFFLSGHFILDNLVPLTPEGHITARTLPVPTFFLKTSTRRSNLQGKHCDVTMNLNASHTFSNNFLYAPAASCMYLQLPVCTCSFLYVPVASCMYLQLPVCTCSFLYVPAASCMYL
ncbi:hypothetical protein F7725_025693 [Dissostichus mawsoni]|uniref:Uncharacterized protein n=1 Tax=Dissostichus mawsoni TaxID=36200 RepID=A0A7J5X6B5_DISMA|nr:hypothetical protein F7725_025693 [Dissostichus mawsoni]